MYLVNNNRIQFDRSFHWSERITQKKMKLFGILTLSLEAHPHADNSIAVNGIPCCGQLVLTQKLGQFNAVFCLLEIVFDLNLISINPRFSICTLPNLLFADNM